MGGGEGLRARSLSAAGRSLSSHRLGGAGIMVMPPSFFASSKPTAVKAASFNGIRQRNIFPLKIHCIAADVQSSVSRCVSRRIRCKHHATILLRDAVTSLNDLASLPPGIPTPGVEQMQSQCMK